MLLVGFTLVACFSFLAGQSTLPDNHYNTFEVTNERNFTDYNTYEVNNTYTNSYEQYLHFPARKFRECGIQSKLHKLNGMSMQPFTFDDYYIHVEPVRFNEVEEGDAIVFKNGEGTSFHAVISIYDDFLVTAGYNNMRSDDKVSPEQIKYRWCFKK
jgi:hypothetical protein